MAIKRFENILVSILSIPNIQSDFCISPILNNFSLHSVVSTICWHYLAYIYLYIVLKKVAGILSETKEFFEEKLVSEKI